jgi:hypothetical protein
MSSKPTNVNVIKLRRIPSKKQNGKVEHMILIRGESMPLLCTIVKPFFHPSAPRSPLGPLSFWEGFESISSQKRGDYVL